MLVVNGFLVHLSIISESNTINTTMHTTAQQQIDKAFTSYKQVSVKIFWDNGNTEEKQFYTCEDAWIWERKQVNANKKRRAKSDRVYAIKSYYAGCAPCGETYGGILSGSASDCELEDYKLSQYCKAKRHATANGLTINSHNASNHFA